MRQARTLRIMQIVFVAYILLLFWILHMLPTAPAPHSMSPFAWSIVCVALLSGVLGFVLQSWILRVPIRPAPTSSQSASRNSPIRRWFAGHVIRMSFSLAVSLYGVILHSTGAPNSAVFSLVGLGLILILLWKPGEIPGGPADKQNNVGLRA